MRQYRRPPVKRVFELREAMAAAIRKLTGLQQIVTRQDIANRGFRVRRVTSVRLVR
jgi:hypothetical protein